MKMSDYLSRVKDLPVVEGKDITDRSERVLMEEDEPQCDLNQVVAEAHAEKGKAGLAIVSIASITHV